MKASNGYSSMTPETVLEKRDNLRAGSRETVLCRLQENILKSDTYLVIWSGWRRRPRSAAVASALALTTHVLDALATSPLSCAASMGHLAIYRHPKRGGAPTPIYLKSPCGRPCRFTSSHHAGGVTTATSSGAVWHRAAATSGAGHRGCAVAVPPFRARHRARPLRGQGGRPYQRHLAPFSGPAYRGSLGPD
jgi:hypothetical protein